MAGSPTKHRRLRSRVQLSRDCASRFGWDLHGKTARSALYLTVRRWGGRWHVRPPCSCIPSAKSSSGDIFAQTRYKLSIKSLALRLTRTPGAPPATATTYTTATAFGHLQYTRYMCTTTTRSGNQGHTHAPTVLHRGILYYSYDDQKDARAPSD